MLKQTISLKNQAEVAKVEAKLEAQVMQIQVLEKTIERSVNDLNEQRKLTKDVAMANTPVYAPQQHSGKSSRD